MTLIKILLTILVVSTIFVSVNSRILQQVGCIKYVDGKCTACQFRTVLINGACVAVSTQCKDWDKVTAKCTLCYDGFKLDNGACT